MSRYTIFGLLLIASLAAFACSTGSPATAPVVNDFTAQNIKADDHVAWGAFDLAMDTQTGTAQIVWNREAEAHFNITKMMQPPNCSNCIVIASQSYDAASHKFTVQLNFRNPTSGTGYDVRAVLSSTGGDKFLLNADGVTSVWGAPMQYRAVNVDAERTFGPGETHGRVFEFYMPAGENFKTVTYLIDASYPSYVLEPLAEQSKADPVVNNNFSTTFIQCYVWDHQNDLKSVLVDLMPLGGSPMTTMYDDGQHGDKAAGDKWYGVNNIKTSVPVGMYRISIYPTDNASHMGWGEAVVSVQETTGGDNHDPQITGVTTDRTTANGNANEKVKITVTAADLDGDALSYKFTGSGTFSGQTGGIVYWKPSSSSTGKQTLNVEVDDPKGGKDTGSLNLWSTNLAVISGGTGGMVPAATLPCAQPKTSIHMADDFKGKVLYCNFWATWCGYCVAEMPDLNSVYQNHKSNPDYVHVLVDLQESEATVNAFISGHSYQCSYWAMDSGSFFNACNDFNQNSTGIPQHVLFDRDGRCRWANLGALSSTSALEAAINQLL
jgi:thiol-disulfide isomerase/thioredoxin